tara:strand:+ start:2308 stop:2451 length:144 start_codon:yes stop_codon:yes gene_type:complete
MPDPSDYNLFARANFYDSMANFYEAQGEMERALKLVKQAFAIRPQVY